MRTETTVARDLTGGDPSPGPLAARLRLERVLVVPMRALDREVGVLVYNRPQASGDFDPEQVSLAEYVARYLGVAVDNVRLMLELGAKRRDLELVRDSSLDFAQSLDMTEVLEAVVTRLLDALGMHACDVYEVDQDAGVLRVLVSFDDLEFDEDEWTGRELPLDHFAASALAVASRRPVLVTSLDDPRLSDVERELLERLGHQTQLSIPLRIRDRVIALVELFDTGSRATSATRRSIWRAPSAGSPLSPSTRRDCTTSSASPPSAATVWRGACSACSRSPSTSTGASTAPSFRTCWTRSPTRRSTCCTCARRPCSAGPASIWPSRRWPWRAGLRRSASPRPRASSWSAAGRLSRCRPTRPWPAASSSLSRWRRATACCSRPSRARRRSRPRRSSSPTSREGEFDDEDRLLVATLGAQLSASLHNATAYQREHAIAETFQQALLMEPPAIPGIDVGVRYRAATDTARVGGDFYDLVTLGPGRLMVIVGDVCGKSLSAAAQSAVVRYMLRAYAAEGSPGEALSRLNAAVIAQTPDQPFVTLVVAYIDVARHMFEYAVAGHPRPIVLAGHGPFPMPGEGNVPVGIFRGAVYPTNRAILPDDSCVVLYTDGITDARIDGTLFGEARLQRDGAAAPRHARAGAGRHHPRDGQGLRRRRAGRRLRGGDDPAAVSGRARGGRRQRLLTTVAMASATASTRARRPRRASAAATAASTESNAATPSGSRKAGVRGADHGQAEALQHARHHEGALTAGAERLAQPSRDELGRRAAAASTSAKLRSPGPSPAPPGRSAHSTSSPPSARAGRPARPM